MVEETIKTIRETEEKAEALIKEADDKCAAVLEDAKKQAEAIKVQAESSAKENAKNALGLEKQAGEKSMQEALAAVESDIAVLKENARAKESDVIAAVIAELV